MMKAAVTSIAILLASAASAGVEDANRLFLESKGKAFRGAAAVPADTVPEDYDFERAKGTFGWKIALPVDEDDRPRFLFATIRGGKFQKGTLVTFGFKEERISAQRFEKLRRTCPMLAIREGSVRVVKHDGKTLPPEATLHAPTSRPLVYPGPPHPTSIVINPCSRALGHSRGLLGRLGVSSGSLRYDVVLEGPGGVRAELGTADFEHGIAQGDAVRAIRAAIEKADPKRVGLVSDRDVADFYAASKVICRGIEAWK